jgi:hypothetical protein
LSMWMCLGIPEMYTKKEVRFTEEDRGRKGTPASTGRKWQPRITESECLWAVRLNGVGANVGEPDLRCTWSSVKNMWMQGIPRAMTHVGSIARILRWLRNHIGDAVTRGRRSEPETRTCILRIRDLSRCSRFYVLRGGGNIGHQTNLPALDVGGTRSRTFISSPGS